MRSGDGVHLDLLQAVRSRGAEAACGAHASQRKDDRLVQILNDWVSTRTWDQSQAFADAHADDLLDPATAAILDRAAQQNRRDLTTRLHRGLLGCARAVPAGAGSIPASLRICHTVDGAALMPSAACSPWTQR